MVDKKVRRIAAGLAVCLMTGVASVASAQVVNVQTDATWKVLTSVPPAGWNTNAGFDDSAWANAAIQTGGPFPLGTHSTQRIWNTPTSVGASADVYFRKTFATAAAATSAIMDIAADDDIDLWVNGVQVINNSDCLASNILNTNVQPQIVIGTNLIASHNHDCGGGQTFGLYMDVVTPAAVPVMGPTGLLLVSCGLVLAAAYAIRRRMTLVSQ